jgi:hypothetical protein
VTKFLILALVVMLLFAGCVRQLAEKPTSTTSPVLTPTPILVSASPLPVHGFVVGDKPFQFLGAVSSTRDPWSEAKDVDLVKDAKAHGITVLEMEVPLFEDKLGHYDESYLVGLDHLLDTANKNGVYVTLPFIHAYGISLEPGNPYYHPGGIEGLVKNQELKEAFKKRVAVLITRVNTVNGRKYNEDPTIMAWVLCNEIVSAPHNYPKGPPQISIAELRDWVEDMASHVKRLDANHLVTLDFHSALGKFGDNWLDVLEAPSLDFVDVEDAEARFLHITDSPADFYLKVFTLKKPVSITISFTGGALDQAKISNDYSWQSQKLREIFAAYYEMGVAAGFTISSWASDIDTAYQKKGAYTAANQPIAQAFLDIASTLSPRNSTTIPLQFVKIYP